MTKRVQLPQTVVLFDAGGKLKASLFASRREAFRLERLDDQMGMIAVKVIPSESFDEESDYLLRQVEKGTRIENQLVFGASPLWAGGKLFAGRCLLDSGDEAARLLSKFKSKGWSDSQLRRANGINDDDESCQGK